MFNIICSDMIQDIGKLQLAAIGLRQSDCGNRIAAIGLREDKTPPGRDVARGGVLFKGGDWRVLILKRLFLCLLSDQTMLKAPITERMHSKGI
jgi:hypothetical protein